MNELYTDGGVIKKNPSEIGGTWAFIAFREGSNGKQLSYHNSGVIVPNKELPLITNNLTEMLAMVKGLEALPRDWVGTVYSDSKITLGRAFGNFAWNNIPKWLFDDYMKQRDRLIHFRAFETVLLDGHPTKAQLLSGKGKRGHSVSKYNVWCDKECGRLAEQYLKLLEYEND